MKILDAGISPFGWVVRASMPILVGLAWRGVKFMLRNPD